MSRREDVEQQIKELRSDSKISVSDIFLIQIAISLADIDDMISEQIKEKKDE